MQAIKVVGSLLFFVVVALRGHPLPFPCGIFHNFVMNPKSVNRSKAFSFSQRYTQLLQVGFITQPFSIPFTFKTGPAPGSAGVPACSVASIHLEAQTHEKTDMPADRRGRPRSQQQVPLGVGYGRVAGNLGTNSTLSKKF